MLSTSPWLAETQPAALARARLPILAEDVSARRGPDAVAAVLGAFADDPIYPAGIGLQQTWGDLQATFERGPLAQAKPNRAPRELLDWPTKATSAWGLVGLSAQLLVLLAIEDPELSATLRVEVARLERAAGT